MVKLAPHIRVLLGATLAVILIMLLVMNGGSHPGLSRYITVSSISPGSTPYEQASWFSNGLKRDYGIILHNIYAISEDVVTQRLMSGRVDYAFVGLPGSYEAQEGLFPFWRIGKGPQPVRLVMQNRSPHLRTLITKKGSGITSVASLRGRRVPWVRSLGEVNYLTLALLHYAGLSTADVRFVFVNDPEASIQAMLDGKVDVAYSPSRERVLFEAHKKGAQFSYIPMPANAEKWRRTEALAPFFHPVAGSMGGGLGEKSSVTSAGYSYPLVVTRADMPAADVERFTEALLNTAPNRARIDPTMGGWDMNGIPLDWVVPFHEGAVAVFKKKGWWTAAHEERNKSLIERQAILIDAWNKLNTGQKFPEDDAMRNAWVPVREKALKDASFSVGFVPLNQMPGLFTQPK
jgi:TRAP transporter TAXI family solute receptor